MFYVLVFALTVVLAGVLAVAGAWAARRCLAVVEIEGTSMAPAYRPGDRVLIRRTGLARLAAGQVVVFQHGLPGGRWRTGPLPAPQRVRWLIKRVVAVAGDPVPEAVMERVGARPGDVVPEARLVVIGDGRVSEDSRAWGYLPADRVLGVVVRRLGRTDHDTRIVDQQ